MEQKMSARLGFLVLISYFGDILVDEDISNVLFVSAGDCCLLHKLISQNSIIGVYINTNLKGVPGREK